MSENNKNQNTLANLFTKNFILPPQYKKKLVDINLKRLVYISLLLFTFGVALLVLCLSNNYHISLNPNIKGSIYYYGGYIIFYGIITILSFIFKKKTSIPTVIRNIPVYLSIIAMIALCLFDFFKSTQPINAFIIFSCISMTATIFLYIEPIFLTLIMLFTIITMAPILITNVGIPTFLNASLFTIIMILLSLYKWNTTIKDFQHTTEQETYTKNLEKEINLAAFVQKNFYKQNDLHIDDWSIGTYSEAMSGVSGDMYDFYYTKNKLDGLGVFDVSGHGIASGLVTMLVKNIIHQEFYQGLDAPLQDVLSNINTRVIEEKGDIENYLTGTLIRINGNKVEFINAGNPHPIIYIKETDTAFFHENKDANQYGVIGMADFPTNYSSSTIELNSGDIMLFYTDGIIENSNEKGFPFGKKNLIQVLQANTFKTCDDQLNDIMTAFKEFKGDTRSTDDITLVMLKKL